MAVVKEERKRKRNFMELDDDVKVSINSGSSKYAFKCARSGLADGRSDMESYFCSTSEDCMEEKRPGFSNSIVAAASESDSDGLEVEATILPPEVALDQGEIRGNGRESCKKNVCLGSGGADRILRYLSKRVVQVSPLVKNATTSFTAAFERSRFNGHCSNAPQKTVIEKFTIMDSLVEVTTTNEAAVVDHWLLENMGPLCGGVRNGSLQEGCGCVTCGNSNYQVGHSVPRSCQKAKGTYDAEIGDRVLLGLDVEWRPNRLRGEDNKVALLQISTETRCLLIQMLFLDSTPRYLASVLGSPEVVLGGVGIKEDAYKLARDHGIACSSRVIELNALAERQLRTANVRQMGLKQLANFVLGKAMVKNRKVTMSDWARQRLGNEQVKYAAMDAWVSYSILRRLVQKQQPNLS